MTSESAFIAALRTMATHPAARGLNDDCAVFEAGGLTLVITQDAMAEGVHFLPGQDPADVAWKLVASNMSDLAAKGAEPLGVLLSYQLAADDTRFAEGLKAAIDAHEATLWGGDTIAGNGGQVLSLTAIGRATHAPVPSRAGAKPGDALWLTGPVGAAMLGFEAYQAGSGDSLAWRRPQALLSAGWALAPHVSAMMDVSDGLLLDAARMAEESAVTIAIDGLAVPLACPEPRRAEALRWGEDYQLLFTAPPQAVPPVAAYRIGEVRERDEHALLLDNLPPQGKLGYEHR